MDRIENARLDHDEEGILILLEGDFVDTCQDYINRVDTDPDINTIALRVDRNVLSRIRRETGRYVY